MRVTFYSKQSIYEVFFI